MNHRRFWIALALSGWSLPAFALQEPAEDRSSVELTPEARAAADRLDATLPADSEARVMLESILSGVGMKGGNGWFRVAVPQSRYDWAKLAERFDADRSGVIEAREFPGEADDFRAIDRNGDGGVTSADLAWEAEKGSPEFRGLSNRIDRDGDGRLTREELVGWAERTAGEDEAISLEELRRRVAPPESELRERKQAPSASTLILGLERQEIGSHQAGPALDEAAPDFELVSTAGETIRLSDRIGERPIVLIFGNYTCSPFRAQAGNLERLYRRYGDRATFLMVYVREAHPEDGWASDNNARLGVEVLQPTTFDQRMEVARSCTAHLGFDVPVLVDTLGDEVGHAYSGGPARLYLIDRAGKVAFKGGRGPHFLLPSQLESAIVWLLADDRGPTGDESSTD